MVSTTGTRINQSHGQKASGMDADDQIYSSNSLDAPDPVVESKTDTRLATQYEGVGGVNSDEPASVLTGPIVSLPTVTEYRCPGE